MHSNEENNFYETEISKITAIVCTGRTHQLRYKQIVDRFKIDWRNKMEQLVENFIGIPFSMNVNAVILAVLK